jgi:hypothetical protein
VNTMTGLCAQRLLADGPENAGREEGSRLVLVPRADGIEQSPCWVENGTGNESPSRKGAWGPQTPPRRA